MSRRSTDCESVENRRLLAFQTILLVKHLPRFTREAAGSSPVPNSRYSVAYVSKPEASGILPGEEQLKVSRVRLAKNASGRRTLRLRHMNCLTRRAELGRHRYQVGEGIRFHSA